MNSDKGLSPYLKLCEDLMNRRMADYYAWLYKAALVDAKRRMYRISGSRFVPRCVRLAAIRVGWKFAQREHDARKGTMPFIFKFKGVA